MSILSDSLSVDSQVSLDAKPRRNGARAEQAERQRIERRLLVQYAIASILAESQDVESASAKILQAICEGLEWDFGQLWLAQPGEDRLRLTQSVGASGFSAPNFERRSRRRAFRSGIGLPGRVWATGEPYWLPDLASDSNFPRAPSAIADGLHSGFGFPIKLRDQVLGAFEFFSARTREPDEELLQASASLGSQIGQFIERTRIQTELRESINRTKLALEAAGMGTWEWDVKTGKMRWSEALTRIHGLAPGTFDGTFETFLKTVHPDDRGAVVAGAQESPQGDLRETEYRIIRPDSTVRWIYSKGQAIHDAFGRPQRMFVICMDITDRKLGADRAHFLSEASGVLTSSLDYDTVLQRLADLIVGGVADWCAIDMLSDERSVRRVVVAHADPTKEEIARMLQRYAPDPARTEEVLRRLQQGEAHLFRDIESDQLTAASVLDESHYPILRALGIRSVMVVPLIARGNLLGAITFVSAESGRQFDQTDLALAKELCSHAGLAVDNARLYGEAQRIQEQLQRANEAKDEFLGLISHELRTPITTIYGGARLLRLRGDALEPESRKDILADIVSESERLHRIVEDLLVLARAEVGPETVGEPVLLQRIVENAVRAHKDRNPARPFDCRVDRELPAVAAEDTYVEQVLRNLLSNGEKYSPPDTVLEVVAEAGDGEAVVRVMDRGPGIAEQEANSIFDRFYRSPASRGKAGMGLGLTVCKRLVEAQSGKIWAKRRDGGGLEIGFTLPYYQDASG